MREEINNYLRNIDAYEPREEKTTLRYCEDCNYVFEFYWENAVLYCKKHIDMPSYGLEREECLYCKKEKELSC